MARCAAGVIFRGVHQLPAHLPRELTLAEAQDNPHSRPRSRPIPLARLWLADPAMHLRSMESP